METPAQNSKSIRYPLSSADVDQLITFLGGTLGDAVKDPLPADGGEVVAKRCRDTGDSNKHWNVSSNITLTCSAQNEQCQVNCRPVSLTGPDGKTVIYEQCDVVNRVKPGSGVCWLVISEQ